MREIAAHYSSFDFVFTDRSSLDLSDEASIHKAFEQYKPSFLVNCAAYTAVDAAETDRDAAIAINATAPGVLAKYCGQFGTKLLHISTDYVFDGTATRPYTEADPVNPVNFYGETKLLGEQQVQQQLSSAIIIRTSWVYSYYGKNFVKTMMRLMNEREQVKVVSDQLGSPTYAADFASVIMHIITSDNWKGGIYHFSNDGAITWYEFAVAIAEAIRTSCSVEPIPTSQFPTPAQRPTYSVLNKQKITSTFGLTLSPWKESLQKCIAKFDANIQFH